jgi:hypothetical protein
MNNCCEPNCDTVQLIEPKDDLIVDTGGTSSDLDERGVLELTPGQTQAVVVFTVPKINGEYNFEYLYIEALGDPGFNFPGAIQIIPTVKAREGFAVVLAGTPIAAGYVLHWRVTIIRTSTSTQVDAPEDLYLQMPRTNTMAVSFSNPRSSLNYGFSELRVENLHDAPAVQAVIRVQVAQKTVNGFLLAVNPTPRTDFYFLRVRTP